MVIKDVIARILPPSIKDLYGAYKQQTITKRLFSLPISDAGVSEEGIPFVKLENGLIFYGYTPKRIEKYIYKYFLNKKIKATLPEITIAVALDILRRYIGPESDPVKHGKYYDLRKGSTIVECGAYIGYYAMRAAEIVGKHGRVVAIEPVKENLRLLSMNVEKNSFQNITIVPKGVWKEKTVQNILMIEKQRASLISEVIGPCNNSIEIECDTIDNILQSLDLIDQIDFIRIQINGAEIEALRGMVHTLNYSPKLLIAASHLRDGRPSYEKVISILNKNGYSTRRERGNVFAWKT